MIRFLFIALCVFNAPATFAQDSAPQETADVKQIVAPLAEAEILALEQTGIYGTASEGGFGRNMWEGSTRNDITTLIRNLPTDAKDPLVNKMILSALLTKADTSKLTHKGKITENLLTLRLEKLIKAGAYIQAYEMYNGLEREPYSDRAAKAAILSMLYSGERSNACLEINIYGGKFNDDSFWQTLKAYCTATLSEEPVDTVFKDLKNTMAYRIASQDEFTFPYTPKSFNALPILDQALLAAENAIDVSGLDTATVDSVPNRHVQILLHQETLIPEHRLMLTGQGVVHGLLPQNSLDKLYASLKKSENVKVTDGAPPEEAWKTMLFYHGAAEKASDTERWGLIQQGLKAFSSLGPAPLGPFTALIAKTEPPKDITENLSLEELRIIYVLFLTHGEKILNLWNETVDQYDNNPQTSALYLTLKTGAAIHDPSTYKPSLTEKIFENKTLSDRTHLLSILKFFMKNIDKDAKSAKNNSTYEKDFFLTSSSGYVMPTSVVWDRLEKTKQNKAVGETILLSTYLMHSQYLHRIYPGVIRDIVLSTRHFNLNKLSKDIAVKAVLGSKLKEH